MLLSVWSNKFLIFDPVTISGCLVASLGSTNPGASGRTQPLGRDVISRTAAWGGNDGVIASAVLYACRYMFMIHSGTIIEQISWTIHIQRSLLVGIHFAWFLFVYWNKHNLHKAIHPAPTFILWTYQVCTYFETCTNTRRQIFFLVGSWLDPIDISMPYKYPFIMIEKYTVLLMEEIRPTT